MKLSYEKLYIYTETGKSEQRAGLELHLSRPGYLWLLLDIALFHRCFALTLRVGKHPDVARQPILGDSGINRKGSVKSPGKSLRNELGDKGKHN